jgi:predicted lipid-binding transport protein (Tim44 family)
MGTPSNLKPSTPNWKLIAGVVVGGLVALWLIVRILSALAGLIKFGIIVAVIAFVVSVVLKQINGRSKK